MNDMTGTDGGGSDYAERFQRIPHTVVFPGTLPRAGMQCTFGALSREHPRRTVAFLFRLANRHIYAHGRFFTKICKFFNLALVQDS